jgi:hypothetical protein
MENLSALGTACFVLNRLFDMRMEFWFAETTGASGQSDPRKQTGLLGPHLTIIHQGNVLLK